MTGYDTFHFADFHDPDVTRWNNIDFYDNYYQTVANPTGLTFTPNGRSVDGADIDRQLDGRAGFTSDDRVGGTHGRVTNWYAGTVDLNATEIGGERVFRALSDQEYVKKILGIPVLEYNDVPWYVAYEANEPMPDYAADEAIWDGIGEGWYWSVMGGGYAPGSGASVDVSEDNTEYDHVNTPVVPMPSRASLMATLNRARCIWANDFPSSTRFPAGRSTAVRLTRRCSLARPISWWISMATTP